MKPVRLVMMASAAASTMALLVGTALAQGGAGQGTSVDKQGAAAAASAPGMGMGPGMRQGRSPSAQWGSDFTPGWSLMTRAERSEHRKRMRAMKTYEECKTYIEQHHQQMAARATERGRQVLAQPPRDACAGLKP